MYLIRRVWNVKPGSTRQAAKLVAQIGKAYEEAGQRSPTRVYWSGYTVPGPADRVYMDWIQEKIESPFRDGNAIPGTSQAGKRLRELVESSHIEFYEIAPGTQGGEV